MKKLTRVDIWPPVASMSLLKSVAPESLSKRVSTRYMISSMHDSSGMPEINIYMEEKMRMEMMEINICMEQ